MVSSLIFVLGTATFIATAVRPVTLQETIQLTLLNLEVSILFMAIQTAGKKWWAVQVQNYYDSLLLLNIVHKMLTSQALHGY